MASGQAVGALGPGYLRMILKDVRISMRLGVHAWEKNGPQPVIINVEMFTRDPGKLAADGVHAVVNYDLVRDAIATWPERPHVELIETLLEELSQLCFSDARVEACRISIVKPEIFPEVAEAGVELFRTRSEIT